MEPSTDDLPIPQQDRSRVTRQKILDTTAEMLLNTPAGDLSVRQVLKRSGVSNGSFYAMFPNKDALIQECWKGLVETVSDNLDQNFDQWLDRPLAEKVHALMTWQIKRYFQYREIFRAYLNMLRTTDLKPTRENLRSYKKFGGRTTDFLMSSADEIHHPDPVHAIDIAVFVTYSAARELIFFPKAPHASSMKMSQAKMIDELSDVFLSCLWYRREGA